MEDHESYVSHLDGRIAAIEEAWGRLKAGWDNERLAALYLRVSEISDDSGHQSLFQLNENAFSLQVYLSSFVDTAKTPSAEQLSEIDGLIRSLQVAVDEMPEDVPDSSPTQPSSAPRCTRSVYALLSDPSPAKPLLDYMTSHGCAVTPYVDAEQLLQAMNIELPGLIITDTDQLKLLSPLTAELTRLNRQESLDIPLVFISDYSLLSMRVAAMRAGATAYFVSPFDPAAIAPQLAKLAGIEKETPFRITVVEDDPTQAEFAAAILRRAEMAVDVVTDPLSVVDALQNFHPDLILMDIYMPEVNGLELTSIIRDFNEFVTTPIVFLSGERDTEKQMDALSFGGDDFIAKPIDPNRLIKMVTNRVRRSRKLHAAIGGSPHMRDQVTGLLSRNVFISRIGQVLDGEPGTAGASALLYLRPDALIELQAQIGIGGLDTLIAQTGDQLKRLLGPHDQACRWEDHGLAVLLRREDPAALQSAAEQLHGNLTEQPHPAGLEAVRFSGGLYPLAEGEQNVDDAMRLAVRACNNAVQAGGNRVVQLAPPAEPIPMPGPSSLDSTLRSALEQDSFGVYYQPLLDLQTRGSENYEILLALSVPDGQTLTWRKLTQPAMRAGLQQQLDRWVLGRALDILIERRNSGRQTQIFVRQSQVTAGDPEHPAWLREQLKERQTVGTGLVLDYALADLSKDIQAAQRNRHSLQEMGVQLTISRFVAKPAAYKVLRYLDADYVRVARKLLKADRSTISGLISEAHRLGARVIVSHVDDPRAIDLHWSSGADYLQGNFIQRPLEDMDYDFTQVVI
jgi:PleD family two-component response regulator/EAL domain-containing protein (putative c-di-GMP-specific phosphodiesterase class I)